MFVGGSSNLFEPVLIGDNPTFSLVLWSTTALTDFICRSSIWACTREHVWTSCLTSIATESVKTGVSIVHVATASMTCGSGTPLCTACSTVVWKVELCRAFTKAWSATLLTTDNTTVSGLDPVARPASPKSGTTASSTSDGVLVICSHIASLTCLMRRTEWARSSSGSFFRYRLISKAMEGILILRTRDRCDHLLSAVFNDWGTLGNFRGTWRGGKFVNHRGLYVLGFVPPLC